MAGSARIAPVGRIVALAACLGACGARPAQSADCWESLAVGSAVAPSSGDSGRLDLSPAFPYRRYLAVASVEPMGHHFTIWYHDVEPSVVSVRTARAPSGKLVLVPGTGYWGGLAVPPARVRPVPDDVRLLAREVEARFVSACRDAERVKVQYVGEYREVGFVEFIASSRGGIGWHSSMQLAMNEDLTDVVRSPVEGMSGFGIIEVSERAQWLPSSGAPARALLSAEGLPPSLIGEVGEAARRFERGLTPAKLGSFVPKDAPLVPPEYPSRVTATVRLYPRAQTMAGPASSELRVALSLPDAVFGAGASGEAQTTIGSTRYTMRASLTPSAARSPEPGYRHAEYAGTLSLRIEDDAGASWEHAYPATGRLDLEADGVVAPVGLELPGKYSPSKEADELRGTLPGRGSIRVVDVVVDISLFDDPRE